MATPHTSGSVACSPTRSRGKFNGATRYRFFRQSTDRTGWEAISDSDPDWLDLVYRNATWVTQLDGDEGRWETARRDGTVGGSPTSSSTAPALMALMLEALGVRSDHRILEIGTATGYNAGLLTYRIRSPGQVTSIEYDRGLAARARRALHAVDARLTLVTGDGALGHPPTAPYDRIVATCSFPSIPPAWLAQSRPGGLIVANLHRDLGGGALVRLTVAEDGSASGHFLPDFGGFMPTRAHPTPDTQVALDRALRGPDGVRRLSVIEADPLSHPDFGMLAALLLPDAAPIGFHPVTGYQQWLLGPSGSWACLDTATGTVEQHGPDRLWDRLEAAYERWQRLGRPSRERFGLTVTPDNRHILWIDRPMNTVGVSPPR